MNNPYLAAFVRLQNIRYDLSERVSQAERREKVYRALALIGWALSLGALVVLK